jgi:hypothetical protein
LKVEQRKWQKGEGWDRNDSWALNQDAQLVLVFGARDLLAEPQPMQQIHDTFPNAQVIGCSTAGEIYGTRVLDDSIVVTAAAFKDTGVRLAETELSVECDSRTAGRKLATELFAADLAHVMVFSDGLKVNGSELVRGLTEVLPANVAVTGGLSGDGAKFQKTLIYSHGAAAEGRIVAIGLYGAKLRVGYGSLGGWDPFGPERVITKSVGNVLYELDGESALGLYKRYLASFAAGLPATGLRFPLSLRAHAGERPVVRTILAVDEQNHSMTFAGDVPQGMHAQLMSANFDRLVDGATGAAKTSQSALGHDSAELAILISCVGRKLILQQRTEEEVETVRSVLGHRPAMAGFYSYGEISPFTKNVKCELHNQTMTVTILSEAA